MQPGKGKRKSVHRSISFDSDSDVSSPKIPAKEYAVNNNRPNGSDPSNDLTVVISGRDRPMKHYHPTTVNNAILDTIGDYDTVKLLPSGDLAVTCKQHKQVLTLIDRDCLIYKSTSIAVKTTVYKSRPYGSRAVVTGIPVEVTESELTVSLSNYRITFLKRLKRRSENGPVDSLSVLLCFEDKTPPEFIKFSYIRLRTKPYNPPPIRCHKRNRFGHKKQNCRSKPCCCKCGNQDHDYKDCPNENKYCVNCKGGHSAAYAGCDAYKRVASIQIVRERSKVSYDQAKEIVASRMTVASPAPTLRTNPKITYSMAVRASPNRDNYPTPTLSAARNTIPRMSSSGENQVSDKTTAQSTSWPSNITPMQLIAFVAEIFKSAMTASQNERSPDSQQLVLEAASKFLGITIEPQTLNNQNDE